MKNHDIFFWHIIQRWCYEKNFSYNDCFWCMFLWDSVDAYEKSLKNVKVVIDAGHGGFDNGAIEYGYYEDNINLEIALKMKDELEKVELKSI